MNRRIIIAGGGVTGMRTAALLREAGYDPVIIEKQDRLGGKVTKWHKLFPCFTDAGELLEELRGSVKDVDTMLNTEITSLDHDGVLLDNGSKIFGDAVVLCTGYEIFEAERKEEYGYKIYDNVITSVDLEQSFREGTVATKDGRSPGRVALLHCVGSRDEKAGQAHCSKLCCITGVKQAIELKKMFPECEVYNFYMDIRMFGPGYEELYRTAQEDYNVQFIRGRISEASETLDKKIQVKAEDTLIGRPLKITVDILVLLTGMTCGKSNKALLTHPLLEARDSGFMLPVDNFNGNNLTGQPNIFYAGSITEPRNIGECLQNAASAADSVIRYIKQQG